MQSELDSLSSKKVFEYAVHHTSRPIRTKQVYKIKLHADGRISRYKSRLVALDTCRSSVLTTEIRSRQQSESILSD
jgi:hypothetical protein